MGQQNVILNELNLKASQSDGYPSIYGFFNQQHMAMRNDFNLVGLMIIVEMLQQKMPGRRPDDPIGINSKNCG